MDKNYSLEINPDNSLITVTYCKETDYIDRVNLLDELIQLFQQYPNIDVLIDVRQAAQEMTTEQEVEYGQLLAENNAYFETRRTAIVSLSNPHPVILSQAYMAGFKGYCEFNNVPDALSWINGEIR